MGFEKVDIIVGTLNTQAAKYKAVALGARKEVNEHQGASQALKLLAGQMPSFAAEIEKRIEGDEDLSPDTAQKVRVYTKNVIARFQTMCEGNSQNQRNQGLISEGRAQAAEQVVRALLKDIEVELAVAARRTEEAATAEAKEVMKKAGVPVDKEADVSDAKAIEADARAALESKKKSSPRKKRPSKKN